MILIRGRNDRLPQQVSDAFEGRPLDGGGGRRCTQPSRLVRESRGRSPGISRESLDRPDGLHELGSVAPAGHVDSAALAMILRLHFGQVRSGWYTVALVQMRRLTGHGTSPNGRRFARRKARPPAYKPGTSRARLQALLRLADTRGQELDSATAAKHLKVTPSHARKLIADVRKMRDAAAGGGHNLNM